MEGKSRVSAPSVISGRIQSDVMFDESLTALLHQELHFQQSSLNMTAACNYLSPMVSAAMHPALNNIHCEGYPGRRYHEGQKFSDAIEQLAINRAKLLFKADHANVQPYRGTMANVAACAACCEPGDTILGFACDAGGHFTTGAQIHLISQLYKIETYGVDPKTRLLDYDDIRQRTKALSPRVLFAGDTAYPGLWDWPHLREIAAEVGARLVADVSQSAGLIAAGIIDSPVGVADVVTMATYKTLRGPRAGLIVCNEDMRVAVDRAVFPTCQDGTNVMLLAGLASALFEASLPAFRDYCRAMLDNAGHLATSLKQGGFSLVADGTRNHACLIDLSRLPITGKQAAVKLADVHIICNANQIPNDPNPPLRPSGLRLGTAAATTLGMGLEEMGTIAEIVGSVLLSKEESAQVHELREQVLDLRARFRGDLANATTRLSPSLPSATESALPGKSIE